MSVFPLNRVPDILKRMDLNCSQAEAMKTCFGILAIMSREDTNKTLIAKDGMEIILNAMTVHVDRTDVQESGCDLLWSLAFNSSVVKDIIAKFGGAVVLVRALKRHSRSADFLKSACGALSNMCQSKLNQEGVSSQGGLQPLVGSIHVHQTNAKLLPFIFDAIASIIVNNEENARTVSSLGIVPVVVASLSRHKGCMDVVKSGCHTLAILSDVKGQASKIAFAGGVPIILSLLDVHPLYSDLHRVAAVVLLRMLQESAHVGREITCHEGVRILLNSLEKGGAQQDTVAAVTHILYTVTNPSSPASASIEPQLWLPVSSRAASMAVSGTTLGAAGAGIPGAGGGSGEDGVTGSSGPAGKRKTTAASLHSSALNSSNDSSSNSSHHPTAAGTNSSGQETALSGVVMILGQYSNRRDVVRAACRLINNLSGFPNVVASLDKLGILDRIFECVSIHRETKDVLDLASSLVKAIHRRNVPTLVVATPPSTIGLLHVLRSKQHDEDTVVACLETIGKVVDAPPKAVSSLSAERRKDYDHARMVDGKLWEHHVLKLVLSMLNNVMETERVSDPSLAATATTAVTVAGKGAQASSLLTSAVAGSAAAAIAASGGSSGAIAAAAAASGTGSNSTALINTANAQAMANKVPWNKGISRIVAGALTVVEAITHSNKLNADPLLYKETLDCLLLLHRVMPFKSAELTKRIEKLLPQIDGCAPAQPGTTMNGASGAAGAGNGNKRNGTLSSKPPLASGSGGSGNDPDQGFLYNGLHVRRLTGNSSSSAPDDSNNGGSKGASPLVMNRKYSHQSGDSSGDERGGGGMSRTKSWLSGASNHGSSNSLKSLGEQQQQQQLGYDVSEGALGSSTSTSPKKTLPQHPLKYANNVRRSSSAASSSSGSGARLIDTWPNYLERLCPSASQAVVNNRSFLNPTGQDSSVPTRMQLSYESSSAAGQGLMSKCPTPVPYIVPAGGLGEPFAHSLTFDSDFESGNLLRAVQKGESNYDLFLRSDLHTPGHTQWFYFAVANTHPADQVALAEQGISVPPVRVRFNIVNFTKPDSLFNLGMRPVVYSVKDANTRNNGWMRSGSDISYYGNSFQRNNSAGEGVAFYYTLSFTIEFQHPGDTVMIAYSYPYTLSDYRGHIQEILDKPGSADVIRQFKLCQTLSGEDCDLLVITNFADQKDKERIGPINLQMTDFAPNLEFSTFTSKSTRSGKSSRQQLKPAIFISGRVHPGETPASWMMKGMMDFLTSSSSQAQLLRQIFVIFVVPMLNPDGVKYGNNRCSLAGVDLNRQWKLPIKAMHPTVYFLKSFMMAQRKLREVHMYIDLHGHSRKYNVFMYGCDDKKRPRPQVRAFPRFFSLHNVGKKYVCFSDCSFTVKKGRESTARVVVAKEVNIPLSFTLEATFCGSNYGPLKHCHMNIGHLQEVGSALCDAILNFSISEGLVKDAVLNVPQANLKAVAQCEKAIAAEGLESNAGNNDAVALNNSGGLALKRNDSSASNLVGLGTTASSSSVTGTGTVTSRKLVDTVPVLVQPNNSNNNNINNSSSSSSSSSTKFSRAGAVDGSYGNNSFLDDVNGNGTSKSSKRSASRLSMNATVTNSGSRDVSGASEGVTAMAAQASGGSSSNNNNNNNNNGGSGSHPNSGRLGGVDVMSEDVIMEDEGISAAAATAAAAEAEEEEEADASGSDESDVEVEAQDVGAGAGELELAEGDEDVSDADSVVISEGVAILPKPSSSGAIFGGSNDGGSGNGAGGIASRERASAVTAMPLISSAAARASSGGGRGGSGNSSGNSSGHNSGNSSPANALHSVRALTSNTPSMAHVRLTKEMHQQQQQQQQQLQRSQQHGQRLGGGSAGGSNGEMMMNGMFFGESGLQNGIAGVSVSGSTIINANPMTSMSMQVGGSAATGGELEDGVEEDDDGDLGCEDGAGGPDADVIDPNVTTISSNNNSNSHTANSDALFSKSTKKGKKKKSSGEKNAAGKVRNGTSSSSSTGGGKKSKAGKESASGNSSKLKNNNVGASAGGNGTSSTGGGGGGYNTADFEIIETGVPGAAGVGHKSSSGGGGGAVMGQQQTLSLGGGGPQGTIVNADFQDLLFRNEAVTSDLAKTQAVATTFGLPKVSGAQK